MPSTCFLSNHVAAVILYVAAVAPVITPASQSHQDEALVPFSVSNGLVCKEGARNDAQKSPMAQMLQGPDLRYSPLDGLSFENGRCFRSHEKHEKYHDLLLRKLITGSDNGSPKLYDIQHFPSTSNSMHAGYGSITYDEFDRLTSVHVNSTDELFLASGYSKNVALYDINSGRRLQVFTDMHQEHINVVRFSNHSPTIFATSSFDQDVKLWDLRQNPVRPCYTASSVKGNVMVCFSPDDHYLLVSAIDNEVKQLLAADGSLHLDFEIPSTGSSQNYTRSYYLNGKDYLISGSCDEHVVRVCC